MRLKSTIKSSTISVLITLLLLALSEGTFWAIQKNQKQRENSAFNTISNPPPDFDPSIDPLAGKDFSNSHPELTALANTIPDPFASTRVFEYFGNWRFSEVNSEDKDFAPGITERTQIGKLLDADRTVYTAKYLYHHGPFRYYPQQIAEKGRSKFFALFGCSQVFGDKITDEFTLSKLLETELKEYQVYNLGVQGGSPTGILRALDRNKNAQILNTIRQEEGIFAYLAIEDHLNRVFCGPKCFRPDTIWMSEMDYYEEQADGSFTNLGPFKDQWSPEFLLYRYLAWSPTANYIRPNLHLKHTDQQL